MLEGFAGTGSSNLTMNLEETADMYSFVWKNIGFVPKYPQQNR